MGVGGFLKMDATLKDDDRSADVTIETVSGVRKIKDYPLRVDWKNNLRNLKYESPAVNLFKRGIIKLCQATSQTIDTMDNVTYNIYSYLRVWIVFDGNFVNVVP